MSTRRSQVNASSENETKHKGNNAHAASIEGDNTYAPSWAIPRIPCG